MYLGKKTNLELEWTNKKIQNQQEEVGKLSWMFNHLSFTDRFIITSKLKESLSSASLKSLLYREFQNWKSLFFSGEVIVPNIFSWHKWKSAKSVARLHG